MSDPRYTSDRRVNDPVEPRPGHTVYTDRIRDGGSMSWVLGALAALAIIGGIIWMMSGDDTNTARAPADTNTGAVTTPAPKSAPSTNPSTPANPPARQ